MTSFSKSILSGPRNQPNSAQQVNSLSIKRYEPILTT